ncbi:hypothetical protein SAE01_40390 [Segetibacter aerophilus]|uniref:50S ribosomal protein L29 n=1 Tax=Segetibacter aerophilus TaxID=670293 RepID=A0A512BHW1_9BACT|nr:hypothetical protein SAE01_40390 [Segetibacter aerophilus]
MGSELQPRLLNKLITGVREEISRLEFELSEAKKARASVQQLRKIKTRIKVYKGLRKSSKV